MDILFDLNIIIDLLIPLREGSDIAKKLNKIIDENKYKKWISSSSISNLRHTLFTMAKKLDSSNFELINIEFKKFMEGVSIFSVSGKSAREAIEQEDIEDYIIYTNFKRIAPEGIVITNDKNFIKNYNDVMTPEEFIKMHTSLNSSTSIPLLDLKEEYRYTIEDIDQALLSSASEARYILGPKVEGFEQKIAEYIGTKYAIGVASGTDALVITLRALALKTKHEEFFTPEDLIITTPFTFAATAESILRAGATPLFVDIDPKTYNIDTEKIKEAISEYKERVKGIIPVHLYGLSADMDPILSLAKENNLFVVEDVAQAFGGAYKGKKLSSIGDVGCLSFFPSKNLGAYGDGGAITTNNEELATYIKMLRKHGGKDKYNVEYIGYNSRLDTIQAAILLEKLKYVDTLNEKRREIAHIYNSNLKDLKYVEPPIEPEETYHVYHQYTIRVKNNKRDTLQKDLKEYNISSMIYYPIPLHKMKVFETRAIIYKDLTESEEAAKEVLSLPIEPLMKMERVMKVIERVRESE